jgi:hypothetical protein
MEAQELILLRLCFLYGFQRPKFGTSNPGREIRIETRSVRLLQSTHCLSIT